MKRTASLLLLLVSQCINAQSTIDSTHLMDTGLSRDTVGVFEKVDFEATYPGGITAWQDFLLKTIDPDRAIKDVPRKVKSFKQTAIVQFIVCTDGTLCDIKVVNNVLPSVRREAMEAIRKSGSWEPAMQNGRPVKAYRKQPITFALQ